jgi:DNA-binding transcriptional MerR regulator
MEAHSLKIGELARRSGISVRTLHYYDQIGLLRPSQHTASGYRLYCRGDVARLQQIRSLRSLGLPLKEVAAALAQPRHSPVELLRAHAEQLRSRIRVETRLCERLEAAAAKLESQSGVSLSDLLETIQEITKMDKFEKYYTPEQMQTLARRGEALGEDGMRKAQQDWADLIAEVQQAVQVGLDPKSEEGRSLAARWDALIEAFTGGDPGIRESLARMYQAEPDIAAEHGYRPDPTLSGFLDAARESAKTQL